MKLESAPPTLEDLFMRYYEESGSSEVIKAGGGVLMAMHLYKKTGRVLRLMVRRDRVRIPLWILGIAFFTFLVPLAFSDLYPSQQERDVMAKTMENPAMVAMVGPGNLDHYTIGAMTAHQMLLLTAAVVGLMSILLVTRHTRADEEVGRIELIRTLPVGRLSNLNSTLLLVCGTNVILALVIGFGLFALRIESMDLEGSFLYGMALGATGVLFAGMAALFAQLVETSRGTIGLSITALVIVYLVRAIGDVGNETLSWISPLGWVTKTDAYVNNHWWPIGSLLGAAAVMFAGAYYVYAVRDLGAGFLPLRPGPKYASAFLQSPVGLAFRLQRMGAIAWAVGMLVIGLSYGSVFGDLEAFFAGNEMMEQLLKSADRYSLTERFIPMLMVVMAILGTIPPLMAMNKLYGEEKKSRIEPILGGAVSRPRLMAAYVTMAMINGLVMLSLAAVGLWAAGAVVMDEPFAFGTIYGAAIVYYPALLMMIMLAALLIGFVPRLHSLIWLYLLYSFIVVYLGGLFQFPDWARYLSPYDHIPELPVEDMDVVPVVILTGCALAMGLLGLIGYRRRDVRQG